MSDGRSDRRLDMASLELQSLGVNAPSDYRQKRHAAHRRSLVPSSNNARRNVLERLETRLLKCGKRDAGRGGSDWALPAVMYLVQPPARSGAGGPVRNSEAGRGEPETLESVLAAVGGA
jgi:hypothetical protein